MSIEKRSVREDYGWGKRYIPTCDYCGKELGPEYSYQDAVTAMRSNGWKSIHDGVEWSDACPDCAGQLKSGRATASDDFAGIGGTV